MYQFRKSKENDRDGLADLFAENFGALALNGGALQPIAGRYWVAVDDDGAIVAATGILPLKKSDYKGYEVTWTCTREQHRGKGLIVAMLQKAEAELPDDNLPLYCSCWRIRDNPEINMASVMKHMNMREVLRDRYRRQSAHNACCRGCPLSAKTKDCYCSEDLYMKDR